MIEAGSPVARVKAAEIARALHGLRRTLGVVTGESVPEWGELTTVERNVATEVVLFALHNRVIAEPAPLRKADGLLSPHGIDRELRSIASIVESLRRHRGLYESAHEAAFSSSSGGEIVGGKSSLESVDPTGSMGSDVFEHGRRNSAGAYARHELRRVGRQIRDAHTLLLGARTTLLRRSEATAVQSEAVDGKADLTQAELDELIDRRRRDA